MGDEVDKSLAEQLRVLITAVGTVGERMARSREHAVLKAQFTTDKYIQEVGSWVEMHRTTARVELVEVHRDEWWTHATREQIAHAYMVSRTWSRGDTEAARAGQRIRDEVRTRYGITDIEDYATCFRVLPDRANTTYSAFILDRKARMLTKQEVLDRVTGLHSSWLMQPGKGDQLLEILGWKGRDADVDTAINAALDDGHNYGLPPELRCGDSRSSPEWQRGETDTQPGSTHQATAHHPHRE